MKTLNNYLSEALINKETTLKVKSNNIQKTSDLLDAMHEVFDNYYNNIERENLRQNIQYYETLDYRTKINMFAKNDKKLCYLKKFVDDLAISLKGTPYKWGGSSLIITTYRDIFMFSGGLSIIIKNFFNYFC